MGIGHRHRDCRVSASDPGPRLSTVRAALGIPGPGCAPAGSAVSRSGFSSAACGAMVHLMIPLSVLDLSPITEGADAGQPLRNSLDLARHVEALGYRRYWMAEHHNLPGIASAATAVALAHVAAGTNSIRLRAGGIMLANHDPLWITEQFA